MGWRNPERQFPKCSGNKHRAEEPSSSSGGVLIAVAYPGPTLRPRSIPQNVENLEFGTHPFNGLAGDRRRSSQSQLQAHQVGFISPSSAFTRLFELTAEGW